jgi:capsular polysaccharide transport system ATP-binding protein
LSVELPDDRNIAIIGRNGSGKSTLLSLIAGTLRPNRGKIVRKYRTSWPLGFVGGMHPNLTGRQNAKFIARIYGVRTHTLVDYVAEFSELGDFFDLPVRSYSHGMRARLAFAISIAVDFDCYLVDEIIGVGDDDFRAKCREEFRSKLAKSQLIMVSHTEENLREFCRSALLLGRAEIVFYDDLEQALEAYHNDKEPKI